MNNREKAAVTEKITAKIYISKGYRILDTNWHYHRMGEIDIIAEKDGLVVFTEVKCRKKDPFKTPSEAVNQLKINRIRKLSSAYIYSHIGNFPNEYPAVRFDVAEVTETENEYAVRILENAF